MIINLESLHKIIFPIYPIRRGESVIEDYGVKTINGKMVDDTNVNHPLIFGRRLISSQKLPLYHFQNALQTYIALFKYNGRKRFFDSAGKEFSYKKTHVATIYSIPLIKKVDPRDECAYLSGVDYPIPLNIHVPDDAEKICVLRRGRAIYGIWSVDPRDNGRSIKI